MQSIRFGGVEREKKRWPFYRGGSWRIMRKAWIYKDAAWRQFYTGVDPITLTAAPNPFAAFSFNSSTVFGDILVTPAGGLAPFTYNWTVLSHTAAAAPTITLPTAAGPTLIQTGVALEVTEEATFRVTVNDSAGQTATLDVPAYFTNNSFS